MSSPEKTRFLKLAKRHGFGRERRKSLGLRFKDIRAALSEMRDDGTIARLRAHLPRKKWRTAIAVELRYRLHLAGPYAGMAIDRDFWALLLAFLKAILPLLWLFM